MSKWEMIKLSDMFTLQMGKTPSRDNSTYWNGDNKWVSIADLGKYSKYVTDTKECITNIAVSETGIKATPPNTVIMSFKLSIGKTAITTDEIYTNEAIMSFIDKGIYKFDINYIYHLFSGKDWSDGANKAVMGITLNKATLSQIRIPLPPLETQKQIAANLDKATHTINLCNEILEKLDLLVKARFVEMFGDPVDNPMRWEKKTLKEVCIKLNDGTHFSPESFEIGEYKYITAKNIKMSGFDFTNITYVSEEVHRPIYERCNPELGDVLYIKDGVTTGIAMVNTLEEEFTLLSSVALLKHNRRIMNGHFLTMLLNNENMYTDIRSNMGGAAITRLTISKLNAIKVILPPINLQNQFADFVTQTDKSKLAVKQVLEKAETLKKALMQEYFG